MQIHEQCQDSVPKQNEQLYKTGCAQGDVRLRRILANNLLPLENASGLLRAPLPRCSISLLTSLKKFGINLPIRPSVNFVISSFRPRLSQKKMYSVLSRVRAKRTPNQLDPLFSVRLVITHVLAHFGIVAWFCRYACLL